MTGGTLALFLLLVPADAGSAEVIPMNSRAFRIPLAAVPADQQAKIQEIILFSSADQGNTWNQASVIKPDQPGFKFYAPADGEFWFNVAVTDKQGKRVPPDIYKVPPRYKVLVDTVKPNVRIVAAQRKGDDIEVSWEIKDQNPDLASLKLEYRSAETPAWMWYTATTDRALVGRTSFKFVSPGALALRLQMMDAAGNTNVAETEIPATGVATNSILPAAAGQRESSQASISLPPPNLGGVAPGGSSSQGEVSKGGIAGESSGSRSGVPSAADRPPAYQEQTSRPWDGSRSVQDRSWMPAGTMASRQSSAYHGSDTDGRQLQPAALHGGPYQSVAGVTTSRWPGTPAVPTQVTNATQLALNYEITRVGPSGVGSVELFLTKDEGRTWERYAAHERLKPPMVVNLPGNGAYGLRLVVTSRAGLGRKLPQSGDQPQMRVEVDTIPPVARLAMPRPDPNRRESLVLSWTAEDNHSLASNPITLQWAERPDAVWQTIAAELNNSGSYTWNIGQNVPYRVYLRLLVRDTAGNVAVDQTPEPVLIDLNEPEIQLTGVSPAGRQ